jgi:hypothetical protein
MEGHKCERIKGKEERRRRAKIIVTGSVYKRLATASYY